MHLLRAITIYFRFMVIVTSFILFSKIAFAGHYESSFIVAKVNDKVITNLELEDRYRFVLFASEIDSITMEEKKSLLNQIIDKMVDEELIRQHAQKLQIVTTQDEIRDAAEMVALRQKKNFAQYKITLAQKNISFVNYARQIDAEIAWSKIISQVIRPKVKITESEIREFFEQQKFNINVKKLLIAQIVIPKDSFNNAAKVAQKLVLELRKGADFQNIVKQFSRDSLSASNNGEIGWVSQRDIDQRIYKSISMLKHGEYSDPVMLDDGYYIFKVINSKIETKIEDEDLEVARQNIYMSKLQNLSKGYLMDLRKDAFIEVDRKNLMVSK